MEQMEFDFAKTKEELVEEYSKIEKDISAIDDKINTFEGLMKEANRVEFDKYKKIVNKLLTQREQLQCNLSQIAVDIKSMECDLSQKVAEAKSIELQEKRKQAEQVRIDAVVGEKERELDDVNTQINENNESAKRYKTEAMIYSGRKSSTNEEISKEQEKLASIEAKLTSLNIKKEGFAKINENYSLDKVKEEIESYKTWIIENNGKSEVINKYLKLKATNKETKEELRNDRNILLAETKALKEELKKSKALEKILVNENKVDTQIAKTEKRISKKKVVINALREDATECRARALYNESMYQNMLSKNKKLREEADKIKEEIENIKGNKTVESQKLDEEKIKQDAEKIAFVKDEELSAKTGYEVFTSQN